MYVYICMEDSYTCVETDTYDLIHWDVFEYPWRGMAWVNTVGDV